MSKYKTGSLFETTEVDSRSLGSARDRLRGNDKEVVCNHIIRVAIEKELGKV